MPPSKTYSCFLFDLDGTLIDTVELIYRCFKYSLSVHGGKTSERETIVARIGMPLREQFRFFFPDSPESFIEQVMTTHMEYQLTIYKDHVRAFDGAIEAIKGLHDRGKILGVVTSRRFRTASLYLEHVGLRPYFSTLVTPESTPVHKPDPAPAIKALDILGCTPSDSLFVGDSRFDIECGAAAGTDTALVSWSEIDPATFSVIPTIIINDFKDLWVF